MHPINMSKKKKKVLLIEKNPAVQAMASLALGQIGLIVRTITNPAVVNENIAKILPDAIICSDSIAGFDPFELASALKKNEKTKETAFILLVERDNQAEARNHPNVEDVGEIIAKPFRSGQLARAVERAMQNTSTKELKSDSVMLLVKEPFLQKVFEKLFDKHNIGWKLSEDSDELISATQNASFPAIIVEWEAIEDLSWFDPEKMGELIVIIEDQTNLKAIKTTDKVHFVTRPLSYEKLQSILSKYVDLRAQRYAFDVRKLEHGAQAMLAAKISAAIFERLVNQQALRDGKWDTAGAAAEEELLRICREFETLFPMRSNSSEKS